jgi:3-keto-disaccharide hydrolase
VPDSVHVITRLSYSRSARRPGTGTILIESLNRNLVVRIVSGDGDVMKTNALALAVFIVLSPSLRSAQSAYSLTAQEKAQGWQPLFDGKTLAGWHVSMPAPNAGRAGRAGGSQPPAPGQVGSPRACVGAGAKINSPAGVSHWEVVDGQLTACGTPTGYLTSDQSYKNFALSIEFKCGADTNSGIFVRSPQENGGYEVQIWRQQPAGYNTGSIVSVAKTAREYAFKADQWNRYEITADGDHLTVVLNGETTLDVRDDRFPEGHIRLQYQQFPIAFRNIKIRPLP